MIKSGKFGALTHRSRITQKSRVVKRH